MYTYVNHSSPSNIIHAIKNDPITSKNNFMALKSETRFGARRSIIISNIRDIKAKDIMPT